MIDKKHQKRGYGKEALKCAIDSIKTFPCGPAEDCAPSCEPENEAAKNLYSSLGFVEFDPKFFEEEDEVSAVLEL